MDKEPMEVVGVNAYELRKDIARQYQGDGEFQASETNDEILEGESAKELSGANTESDSQVKSQGKR